MSLKAIKSENKGQTMNNILSLTIKKNFKYYLNSIARIFLSLYMLYIASLTITIISNTIKSIFVMDYKDINMIDLHYFFNSITNPVAVVLCLSLIVYFTQTQQSEYENSDNALPQCVEKLLEKCDSFFYKDKDNKEFDWFLFIITIPILLGVSSIFFVAFGFLFYYINEFSVWYIELANKYLPFV